MNARERSLKALYAIEEKGAYANQALSGALGEGLENPADRALVTELVWGVLQNRTALDYIIARFSKIKLKKLSPWMKQILRLGVYQLYYMDRIPDSAACNESVKLAKRYGHAAASGFVNGVLRSAARGRTTVRFPDRSDLLRHLATVYSYPDWMVSRLLAEYGGEECEGILRAGNSPHDPTVRVNLMRSTPQQLIETLAQEGMAAEADAELPCCLYIRGALQVHRSAAYAAGLYTLQNRSSMLAAELLAPQPGDFVLDVCAAPGGKTTHIAEKMQNRGRVLAFDIHPHKITLIEAAAKRLGLSCITAQCQDAAQLRPELAEKADRVLADVPCSGLGVINKKPDIKWTRTEADITALAPVQAEILQTAAQYVRPGGVLVYSTCTILKQENQDQVAAFLSRNPAFHQVEEKLLLPHRTSGSGFYLCKLQKRENAI